MARHESSESTAFIGEFSRALLDYRLLGIIAVVGSLAILGTMEVFSDAVETGMKDEPESWSWGTELSEENWNDTCPGTGEPHEWRNFSLRNRFKCANCPAFIPYGS